MTAPIPRKITIGRYCRRKAFIKSLDAESRRVLAYGTRRFQGA
jgi:hypothetical protein